MRRRSPRRLAAVAALLGLVAGASACTPKPLAETTLPGGVATGDDGYTLTADFASTENLVTNGQVLYNNVQIGTIREIKFHDWHARVKFSLLKSRKLPANITLKVGQKSLLGAEYLEVEIVKGATVARDGLLQDRRNDVIPMSRTGRFPETEEVLSGLTLLLGNGGLGQIRTITGEVDKLLKGQNRQQAARSLITQLNSFVGTLDGQKDQIVQLIGSINRLGRVLVDQRKDVSYTLEHITPGLRLLRQQRAHLTAALKSVRSLADSGQKLITESGDSLLRNLAYLKPVLTKLNEAGDALPKSLTEVAAYPFPLQTVLNTAKGDYVNLYATLDFTLPGISAAFGLGLDKIPGLSKLVGGKIKATQRSNSVLDPVGIKPGQVKPKDLAPKRGSSSSSGSPSPTTPSPTTSPQQLCKLLGPILGGC